MIRFSPNPNRANLIRWHEWRDDIFRKAQVEDKPIMLFLTAFWCRFCQRMDEGAFSDDENIALLNAYFIAIRVEDTQRPDVNTRYNLNGWPTIAFMAPEGELLSVTNYLPSEEFGNLLASIYTGYQEKKEEIRSARKNSDETPSVITAPGTPDPPTGSALAEVTTVIMELADRVHGGYGCGQKFIHPEANDFLLSLYEAKKDVSYLDHVRLTLDRMREGEIHDREGGGYFRTCSNADWSRPHREKLLAEHAGLLANCLRTFRITQHQEYVHMAEDIIDYIDRKLSDSGNQSFYGCEDFLRNETAQSSSPEEFFTIIDNCIYADANAQAIAAYLEAASILGKPDYKKRALKALEFLWRHCENPAGGVFHYFDGSAHVPGLLNDQTRMASALVQAHRATGAGEYLEQAKGLADFILANLKNPDGGYYDVAAPGPAYLGFRLTLIEQNGAAASCFLALAEAVKESRYHDAALWALSPFTGNFSSYGIHAAAFGQALARFLKGH